MPSSSSARRPVTVMRFEDEDTRHPAAAAAGEHNNHHEHDAAASSSLPFRTPSRDQASVQSSSYLPPPIYSAPTTDTFGDDSTLVIRPYAVQSTTPTRHHPRQRPGAASSASSNSPTVAAPNSHNNSSSSNNNNHQHIHNNRTRSHVRPTTSGGAVGIPSGNNNSTNSSGSNAPNANKRTPLRRSQRRRRRPPPSSRSLVPRDFQHEQDLPMVTTKFVHVANRSAYEVNPCPTLASWQAAADRQHAALTRQRTGNSSSGSSSNMHRKLSPSQQHLELLHTMQSQTVIRQVEFSPSCGPNADFFGHYETTSSDKRDGRYRPVDIRQAAMACLPAAAPVLSNRKVRLPLRADVGFSGATPAEVQQKQLEISHETEWEEATPRLVALVTSDDLGTAVVDGEGQRWSARHLVWNGGGLEGMPFAGKEMIRAKERNALQWGRPGTGLGQFLQPNPCSMLAPPLEATYSKSQHWRPRPFHDRPPGRTYTLVCPTAIEFAVGNLEPLVGCLTLYTLPVGKTVVSQRHRRGPVYGKMSEDFWFPAGDWDGKVDLNAVRREDGSIDETLLAAWNERKHKAIFSHDPLAQNKESLHMVVQIYKITHLDATDLYTGDAGASAPQKQKSKRSVDAPTSAADAPIIDVSTMRQRADRGFQQFGAQLLTPLCFGVARLYENGGKQWPHGCMQEVQFYSYPLVPDSPEAFVERLVNIISGATAMPAPSSTPEQAGADVHETQSDVNGTPPKRRMMNRLFRSPMKSSRSRSLPPAERLQTSRVEMIEGHAKLFVSSLGVDFLEAMLTTPPELDVKVEEGSGKERLPRLLVDPTGDVAVVLGNNKQSKSTHVFLQKRSDLVRLPVLTTHAGYMEGSELREVLPLPPRQEKHYDFDSPLSYRSLLNLLYLYPRSIRLLGDAGDSDLGSFTMRVRLVRTEASVDEETGKTMSRNVLQKCLHSCSPWVTPGLLDTVYTKVWDGVVDALNWSEGIQLTDEIKLRLPAVIDGSCTLEFTLFSVQTSADSGSSLVQIAEATIPLSSSSLRDAASGGKVTTVIPNGNHRLKLGDFQLQIESRLVSSLHIGDPSVALALRDFPYARTRKEVEEQGTELLLGYSKSNSHDASVDANDTFHSMLSKASSSCVVSHFQILLHMHLCNLVGLRDKEHSAASTGARFMMWNISSLFEVLRKVKSKFLSVGEVGNRQLEDFVKSQIDSFDEGFLSPASNPLASEGLQDLSDSAPDSDSVVELEVSGSNEENVEPESVDEGVFIQSRYSRRHQYEVRVARIVAALGPSGIPFSRVAYGASKTDRMRLEARMQFEGGYEHFFDDDETIATQSTFQVVTTTPREENKNLKNMESFERVTSLRHTLSEDMSDSSIVRSASESAKTRTAQSSRSIGDTEFAKRVKSAAQVMLAPCVGPTLTNILASTRVSPRKDGSRGGVSSPSITPLVDPTSSRIVHENNLICLPGSDLDDDDEEGENADESNQSKRDPAGSVLRGPSDGPVFVFSINSTDDHQVPDASGEYLYESIMVLWLRAWVDYVEGALFDPNLKNAPRPKGTFAIPEFDPSAPLGHSVFSFFANVDFLLPLCLKSIVLRYTVEVLPFYSPSTRAIIDENHMLVLEPFVEMLGRGLMGITLTALGSPQNHDKVLIKALAQSDIVLEFLVGLLSVIHTEHMDVLISKFFRTLRDCETEHLSATIADVEFEWTEESLHRVRCSRQLRLHCIETLAVIPSFLAINYVPKYSGVVNRSSRSDKASWKYQYKLIDEASTSAHDNRPLYEDGNERLPVSGWLSDLLVNEALSICALSSEAVIAEAMAHIEVSRHETSRSPHGTSSIKKRPGSALKRADLIMFQSLSIHAVSCVYELLLRHHAMDKRFQTESARSRIAALFAGPILAKSIASVRWLARMEATHKVRCIWLLCFVYILQETPEVVIQDHVRSYCDPNDFRVHRFIRLLRLCSSTFQSFVDRPRSSALPSELDAGMTSWLLQESFNTVCAATNIVVEACVTLTSSYPHEQRKMMQGLLDLLLHILTTPQSSVTHLRAVGGALQAMEHFGVSLFLEITSTNFQHWIRVILSLMNSISLSVRSIAVDFAVSLFGSVFDLVGNIDEVALIFASVLPEVAAREVAFYCVSGHISTMDDVSKALWPLRRAIADLQDANPLDDDRVDPQLSPILAVFGRTCQAVIDGVLVEMRLKRNKFVFLGDQLESRLSTRSVFDADEESLFETASFFLPETAPMQRIRWLLTLRSVHESKGQWVEAAETLMLCAQTITDSAQHLKSVWRPSRFNLWSDSRRSMWLETVGEEMGLPDRGNAQVMAFAEEFLEPDNLLGSTWKKHTASGKLQQPTLSTMCEALTKCTKEAIQFYRKEDGLEEISLNRLESLHRAVMSALEEQTPPLFSRGSPRAATAASRRRFAEEQTSLRKALASISVDMTTVSERMLAKEEGVYSGTSFLNFPGTSGRINGDKSLYVAMRLSGKKPSRFEESTTLPAFVEWNEACICRVPLAVMQKASLEVDADARKVCELFSEPFVAELQKEYGKDSISLRFEPEFECEPDAVKAYLQVFVVDAPSTEFSQTRSSGRFVFRKDTDEGPGTSVVEMTVAEVFPCVLARQRIMLTTETKTIHRGASELFLA